MPLNLHTNDGDFTPFIKYNAKAGRWYIRVEGKEGDIEVVNPVLAFDMANIKTGWIFYLEGVGPEKVWDPDASNTAPKPAGNKAFKRGFEVLVHGEGEVGVREFSSTAGSMIGVMLGMHKKYEDGVREHPGFIPQFACIGVTPVTGKYGTNYSPNFSLKAWIPSPFGEAAALPATWSIETCINECAKVGLTRDDMVAYLKSIGRTSFNGARDTGAVRDLIRSKSTINPPPSQDADIPFAWFIPFVLATLTSGVIG